VTTGICNVGSMCQFSACKIKSLSAPLIVFVVDGADAGIAGS
jgi:hypothetical protein